MIPTDLLTQLTPLEPIPTGMEDRLDFPQGIRAVLFDVYGTLLLSGVGDIGISSPESGADNLNAILVQCGFPNNISTPEQVSQNLQQVILQHHQKKREDGIDYPEVEIRDVWFEVLERLWLAGLLNVPPNKNFHSMEELAMRYEVVVNPVWPMPGFPEIVQILVKSGIYVGIVSNAQFYTPLFLEAFTGCSLNALGFIPEFCAWSYTEGRAKPSPLMFTAPLEALKNKGIAPDEVLYVGNDMLNDVQAAAASGCQTCLFAGDKRSLRLREDDTRIQASPNVIITNLLCLEHCIVKGVAPK